MVYASGRLDLKDAIPELEDGYIKGATSQVVDEHRCLLLPVDTVSKSACGRFVDDPEHLEACDLPCVFGRLPLGIVEVGGHRDDRFCNLFTQVLFRIHLQLLEDHRGDLLRAVGFVPDGDLLACAHLALDRLDGAFRVSDRLPFCCAADQSLPVFCERHDRGGGPAAFRVGYDRRPPAFHDRHA